MRRELPVVWSQPSAELCGRVPVPVNLGKAARHFCSQQMEALCLRNQFHFV